MKPFIQAYGHYDSSTGTYILSSKIQSLTTSIINVGELVGAVSSYIIGDHLGRHGCAGSCIPDREPLPWNAHSWSISSG